MSTTTTPTAPPAAPAGDAVKDLYKDLQARLKATIKGGKTTKKAVYVRHNLGKATVVYVNEPGKKSIRVEVPKVTGGGYDAVSVKDSDSLNAAMKLIEARVKLVTEQAASPAGK